MNKRRFRRQNCLVPVEGKDDSIFGQVHTFDISKGGIGVISNRQVSIDQTIAIELDLAEGDDPALVIGKVVWVKSIPNSQRYRVGLIFEGLRRGSKSRLDEFFRKKSVSRYT